VGRHVVIGMLDQPETQDQRPAVVDLEESGGLLIHGSGGTGKTTALRTIAAGLDRDGDRSSVATVVFDFASRGLSSLRHLPSVVDVATGDDLEAVTRHLIRLDDELDRRRRLLAQHGAEHLTAFRRDHPGQPLDRIVVLIDGFGGLAAALLDAAGSVATSGTDRWGEIVQRILVDGRQVGIHAVVTTDRRNVVPARLQSSIGARLILRHADPQSYADLGVRGEAAAALETTAGRALLDGRVTVQIAVVSPDPSARAQTEAIAVLGSRESHQAPHPLASAPLPDSVTDHHVDGAADGVGPAAAVIGVTDISLAPAALDVEWSHAVVVGASRSGRSTALEAFLRGAEDAVGLGDVYVVGPVSSPLAALGLSDRRAAFGRADDVGALLDRVANLAAVAGSGERIVLVVDDIDAFDDAVLTPVWERLVASDSVRLVAALETRAMVGYTTNAAVTELRRTRRMLVLRPDDPSEFLQLTGVKLPVRPGLAMVPGRGVLLVDRRPSIVHVAQRSTRVTRSAPRTPAAC
jgi:S-DNA-T family DNA segregation ATPase FtsK/SpoIIIE